MNCLTVFGGVFESEQAVEEYMKIIDGKPERFMKDLYLQGDFSGQIEFKFFEKNQMKRKQYYLIFHMEIRLLRCLKRNSQINLNVR